ncbi:MAG: hypothetical protein HOI23_00710 [Deltaproteobacteria bacterium]|nr:hypothetical protein [Deltaproteobacteria bacterium]
MYAALLMITMGTLVDVDQALVLYDEALYESALETLPPDCRTIPKEYERCERVRGLCQVALGRQKLALTSWTRMCLRNPALAPPRMAPTANDIWTRACERARWMNRFRLDELAVQKDLGTLVLQRPAGPGDRLENILFWLKTPVDVAFKSYELSKFGNQWRSSGEVSAIPGDYLYYLEFNLASGERFQLGTAQEAFGGKAIEHFETLQFSALTNPWPIRSQQDDALIPDWGWWAIAGGVVVVVATAVAIGLSTSDEEP